MRKLYSFAAKEFIYYYEITLRGLNKERTKDEYTGYINLLCNYLNKDFLEISEKDAQKYFSYLNEQYRKEKLSRKTICVRLSCYNKVASCISEQDEEYKNPFELIPRPKVDNNKINPLNVPSVEELDTLLALAKKNYMLYTILCLASRVALSSENIVNLNTSKIVREKEKIVLICPPKNDFQKERFIVLPSDVSKVLNTYIQSIEPDENGSIFFNKHHKPLTVRNLDQYVSDLVKESGITKKYSLKDFRTRAILEIEDGGATEDVISEYIGLAPTRVRDFISAKGLLKDRCPAELSVISIRA